MGKISTNTNLKRRIREFQAQHGVSHSTALKAVDEPLHTLRDLSRLPDILDRLPKVFGITAPVLREAHFRVVGNRGPFSSPWPVDPSDVEVKGALPNSAEARWINQHPSEIEIVKKLSERFEQLRLAGVDDIWSYRELQRAEILPGEMLEPWFALYAEPLSDRVLRYLGFGEGARLGVFPVDVSGRTTGLREITIPVTFRELRDLRVGALVGEPRFLQRTNRKEGVLVERKIYSYFALLESTPPRQLNEQIRVFFGDPSETLASAESKLRELGMDPEAFALVDIRDAQITVTLEGDQIQFKDGSGNHWFGDRSSSERVLELDGELAAEAYEKKLYRRLEDVRLSDGALWATQEISVIEN